MRNIGVRDAPCWDPNALNASSTNCNCERVFAQNCNWLCPCADSSDECVTKRGSENSFPGTQMFVQARNKKRLQHKLFVIIRKGV